MRPLFRHLIIRVETSLGGERSNDYNGIQKNKNAKPTIKRLAFL